MKSAKDLKCGRTKTTSMLHYSIVTNVIGVVGKSRIIDDLKVNTFSILLEESTDRSSLKHLAVMARIIKNSENDLSVNDEFVTLIEVQNATSKSLYNHITQFFFGKYYTI